MFYSITILWICEERMKVQIIHGVNLNMLGKREPEIYGDLTLDQLNSYLAEKAEGMGMELLFFQSNYEGAIVEKIHESDQNVEGIIINPGAFTHYSYAIRDAIASIKTPTIEVHLTDIEKREEFRKISVIRDVCIHQFKGEGMESYVAAMKLIKDKVP